MKNLSLFFAFSLLILWSCQGNSASHTTSVNQEESSSSKAVQVKSITENTPELPANPSNAVTEEETGLSMEEAKQEPSEQSSTKPAKKEIQKEQKTKTAKSQSPNPPKPKVVKTTSPNAPVSQAEVAPSTTIKVEAPSTPQAPELVEEVKIEAPTPPTTTVEIEQPKTSEKPKVTDHSLWDQLLRKHVSSSGKVNYKGFKADLNQLDAYLAELKDRPIQSDWSRKAKMAYWINAYNAFTVKLILDNYPLSSITKLHGGKPWDVKWIKLGGKTYSLNNIENDILRPQYKDARIHFAVNCAARSCPPLLNRAWTESNLNRYFDQQAKAFINNTKYNKVSPNKIEISKIFQWYAEDFGSIVAYINKYSAQKADANAEVVYVEYNWGLNE
ncbi:MAG: DUF547 domain-containing protein [Bacteroidota bacterium]